MQIIEVDPSKRRIVREIRFEKAKFITSCVFGGPNLDELYVTSGRPGDDPGKLLPEVRCRVGLGLGKILLKCI